MPTPNISPVSQTTIIRLPSTGTIADVTATLPFSVYTNDVNFLSGAAAMVGQVYNHLGGNVLNIELEPRNVYSNFQESVLEYSRIINQHQAKNVLKDFLGSATGSFDHLGQFISSSFSASLNGGNPALFFPRFTFSISARVGEGLSETTGIGGTKNHYSASFNLVAGKQEYDLQDAVATAASGSEPFSQEYNDLTNKRIKVEKVFYVSPSNMWRFFGVYGSLNVVGNFFTYGQYADDSTFEVVPVWQNKLQAQAFEDALYTRASHYTYEIHNNKLKIYPAPPASSGGFLSTQKMWFIFTFDNKSPAEDFVSGTIGVGGVNNANTLPFANLDFSSINAQGKQWIRSYCLALCKETLAHIRGKMDRIPIPNNEITLNWSALYEQAQTEKEQLRDQLVEYLDSLTYDKLAAMEASIIESAQVVKQKIPLGIYRG